MKMSQLYKNMSLKAYDYNIQYKAAEYEIFKAATLEDRQTLLDTNAEIETSSTKLLNTCLV